MQFVADMKQPLQVESQVAHSYRVVYLPKNPKGQVE